MAAFCKQKITESLFQRIQSIIHTLITKAICNITKSSNSQIQATLILTLILLMEESMQLRCQPCQQVYCQGLISIQILLCIRSILMHRKFYVNLLIIGWDHLNQRRQAKSKEPQVFMKKRKWYLMNQRSKSLQPVEE